MSQIISSIESIRGGHLWNLYLTEQQENILEYISLKYYDSDIYPFRVDYNNVSLYMINCIKAFYDDGLSLYDACRYILGTNRKIYERT